MAEVQATPDVAVLPTQRIQVSHSMVTVLLKDVHSRKNLMDFLDYSKAASLNPNEMAKATMDKAERQLDRLVADLVDDNHIPVEDKDWKLWGWQKFRKYAESHFPSIKIGDEKRFAWSNAQTVNNLTNSISDIIEKMDFGPLGTELTQVYNKIEAIEETLARKSVEKYVLEYGEEALMDEVLENLTKAGRDSTRVYNFHRMCVKAANMTTFKQLLDNIHKWSKDLTKAAKLVNECNNKASKKDHNGNGNKRDFSQANKDKDSEDHNKRHKNGKLHCDVCGGEHNTHPDGTRKACWAKTNDHPERNKDPARVQWKDSPAWAMCANRL